MNRLLSSKFFWPLAALVSAFVLKSPAFTLLLGALLALIFGNPISSYTGKLSKYLLQFAVILLGFGIQLGVILKVGASSIGITFFTIAFTMAICFLLSKLFKVDRELSTLIGSGTAICGGSAIAAIAPAIGASSANTAVSIAIVFLLNAIALLVFPYVGHFFNLDQSSFGLWAAIAIHDTSSVVGATAIYGVQALAVGTTVKLTRALWILPLSFACSRFNKSESGAKIPWFLGGFLLAALLRSYFSGAEPYWNQFALVGKFLMVVTLFLIGAGLTKESLKKIGIRPLILAITLWAIISIASLSAISMGLISL